MDDWIPISALNQYAYCPRRCYLIHAEAEFEDNVHTLRGTHEHERVDRQRHEVSAGVRAELRFAGLEPAAGPLQPLRRGGAHPDGTIYPVEYKHGKRRRWLNDDLQLAAQAPLSNDVRLLRSFPAKKVRGDNELATLVVQEDGAAWTPIEVPRPDLRAVDQCQREPIGDHRAELFQDIQRERHASGPQGVKKPELRIESHALDSTAAIIEDQRVEKR